MTKLANASNGGGPTAHEGQGQDHLRGNTAMHTHEDGPFRVLVHITGTVLIRDEVNMLVRKHTS